METEIKSDAVVEEGEDEGAILHIVCCASDDTGLGYMKSLCGRPIDDADAPDYDKDEECELCNSLVETDYCPMFGKCQDELEKDEDGQDPR